MKVVQIQLVQIQLVQLRMEIYLQSQLFKILLEAPQQQKLLMTNLLLQSSKTQKELEKHCLKKLMHLKEEEEKEKK